jgi:hypothetical protein
MVRTTLGLVVLLAFQNPRVPPPTVPGTSVFTRPGQTSPTGHSEIHGRVLNARTGQAIAGANVSAVSMDPNLQAVAVSDAAGAYRLFGLPAGRYSVTANALSFVAHHYAEIDSPNSWKLVDLKAGETVGTIDVVLSQGGTIAGTVVDESGSPASRVFVTPLRREFHGGIPHLFQGGARVQSDNRGEFRLANLLPGEFLVVAGPGTPPGYGTTYYPATLVPSKASGVAATADRTSIIRLQLARASGVDVAITVLGPDRRPLAGGRIQLAPAEWNQAFSFPVGSAGRLVVRGMPPGTYYLQTANPDPRTTTASSTGTLVIEEGTRQANVVLTPQKRGAIHGKIVVDAVTRGSFHPSAIQVGIGVAGIGPPNPGPQGPGGIVKNDLTFDATSWPGVREVRIESEEAGWAIKSVHLDGIDMTENGFDVPNGVDVHGLEVELTNKPPQVMGGVTNAQGAPAGQYVALLFAQNRALWKNVTQRHLALARPDQNGRFVVRTLLPGAYLAVAIPGASSFAWTDPAFLEKLRPLATSFTLADGEAKTLNLSLKPLP